MVTTTTDVRAGSPLTISLGGPSNPSPLFATYGFLDNDSPTVFCKASKYNNYTWVHVEERCAE